MEHESLQLITPPADRWLLSWLAEFYGKKVKISGRQLLRHRDLSFVERLWITDGLPATLIFKVVLPPWDIEQDLMERVLIPSICNSGQLYMTAHQGQHTAMFLEDLGSCCLKENGNAERASKLGKELAKLHRAYSYRIDELMPMNILPTWFPIDYEEFAHKLSFTLQKWDLINEKQASDLILLSGLLAAQLAGEPISLVHGDLFAENLITRNNRIFVIDWSWFALLGVPIMDLATITMDHIKNGSFTQFREEIIDAYCFESGRKIDEVKQLLPIATILSRLQFLYWLAERKSRGILGTTIGLVDNVILDVVQEILASIPSIPV